MPGNKLFLLYSECTRHEKKTIGSLNNKSGFWLYFGKDYVKFKNIRSTLNDKLKLIEISEKLDNISASLRDEYNNYIDNLNRLNGDSFEWWFTPLSSRNIYLSEVFQNICYLKLLEDIYQKYQGQDLLIVVESYSTGRIIERWAHDENIPISVLRRPHMGRLFSFKEMILAVGKTLIKTIINYSSAKISALRSAKNPGAGDLKSYKNNVLIDVFVYESNFGEDGSFKDRYFPGLEEFLEDSGYNVIYHSLPVETKLNKYGIYKKIRANERYFIIAEDYLHILDYFRILLMALKAVRYSGNIPSFRGNDISFADRCENKWLCFEGAFRGISIYFLFFRLGIIFGKDIGRIICWYENQLQDRALAHAIHNNFPDTQIVGAQSFIHYSNYLSIFPLNSEFEASMLPDRILTTGPFESYKVSQILTKVPVIEAAALRYSHVFSYNHQDFSLSNDILVLMPADRNDAFETLIRVCEALDDFKGISNILLKCHPDYGEELFCDTIENYNSSGKFVFTDKRLDELFRSVSVVISMASSSIVEAAVLGIPTILLAKFNALNLNPFDTVESPLISICYDSNSLKDSLNEYLQLSVEDREKLAIACERFKEQFFTPVDERTMRAFIE